MNIVKNVLWWLFVFISSIKRKIAAISRHHLHAENGEKSVDDTITGTILEQGNDIKADW